MKHTFFKDLTKAIEQGSVQLVKDSVKYALDNCMEPEFILQEGLLKSMDGVSKNFKNKSVFVPDLLLATRAGNAGISFLSKEIALKRKKTEGRIIIGTVEGDLHDIGKNLVKIFFEIGNFEVIDLGTDVSVEGFIEATRKYRPQVLGLSAALTTTMYGMKDVIKALEAKELREKVFVIIGGAPITGSFARGIKADMFDVDGVTAVAIAKEKLKNNKLK